MEKMLTLTAVFALFFLATPVNAQKLLIEEITKEPPNSLEGVPRPRSGMTAAKVKEIFGLPKARGERIGNPPITRWVYKNFIVVFEGDHVINSVIKKPEYTDLNN